MDEFIGFLLFAIVLGIVTGIIGKWIAKNKGRSEGEGFWLGFLLSIVGLIIEGVLPKTAKPDPVQRASGIDGPVFDAPAGDGRPRRKCPFCAEMILAEASVCRYCQREVPRGEINQRPSSNVLYLNETGNAYHRQDCPEIAIEGMRPIELSEIPQGADPCSICKPPAAHVPEAGAQASATEHQYPAKENSSPATSSSTELNSKQTEPVAQAPTPIEQEAQAPAQIEQEAQAPSHLTCPSCARMISPNDAFCFFCGRKLRK
jgi:hypothetical protein